MRRTAEVSSEEHRPVGYRARQPGEVAVGDRVWFVGLHQSRTGMVVRAPVEGRVVAVWPTLSRWLRLRHPLTLEVQLDAGPVRPFPLPRRSAVFVRQRAVGKATPPVDAAD